MATHSSILAWRILGMAEPGGLPSVGLHRVTHDLSDLAEEYTEELYKNHLHDPDNHDGVITHLARSWNAKSSGP